MEDKQQFLIILWQSITNFLTEVSDWLSTLNPFVG